LGLCSTPLADAVRGKGLPLRLLIRAPGAARERPGRGRGGRATSVAAGRRGGAARPTRGSRRGKFWDALVGRAEVAAEGAVPFSRLRSRKWAAKVGEAVALPAASRRGWPISFNLRLR